MEPMDTQGGGTGTGTLSNLQRKTPIIRRFRRERVVHSGICKITYLIDKKNNSVKIKKSAKILVT